MSLIFNGYGIRISYINFNSTKEASQALGIASSNITRALKENRTAGGYIFKYKEMENI
jgi:hypothetical protein